MQFQVIPLCKECEKVIREPNCSFCLRNEVYSWLRDQKIPKSQKQEIAQDVALLLNNTQMKYSQNKCIHCGNNLSSLCRECFMKNVWRIVQSNTLNIRTLKSFDAMFHVLNEPTRI